MSKSDEQIIYYVDNNLIEYNEGEIFDCIKNRHRKITKARGYNVVNLGGIRVFVHKIGAYIKYGKIIFNKDYEINHIDENPQNNSLNNIELVSHRQNMMHSAYKQAGENNPQAKLTLENVESIKHMLNNHTQSSIAKLFGVSRSAIASIAQNRSWQYEDS